MRISVIGTGYVGLVTGVCLADIGHVVTCIDLDETKVEKMKKGIPPIFEPGLQELMVKNISENRLSFTTNGQESFLGVDAIYIAVGTPENEDGSANLFYVEEAAKEIARNATRDSIIVIKSTVPVGTNKRIQEVIQMNLVHNVKMDVVSNPEFLREGSAIRDCFQGDRIVIGADTEEAGDMVAEINRAFGVPIYKTDVRSAEMIKYASNAFLATKISFINEISNICELVGANIEDVSEGMGMDKRIGSQFLKAGIGYGGSCFPKDTKALIQIAGNVDYEFELLKGVINVNKKQQGLLIAKLTKFFPTLSGKRIAVLGLAFKPNTDDMREAASIMVTEKLIGLGAQVIAYDPVAVTNARTVLHPLVAYSRTIEEALENSDAALILTEWEEIANIDPVLFKKMKKPLVIDGRNCFSLNLIKSHNIEYHSIGRPSVGGIIETARL